MTKTKVAQLAATSITTVPFGALRRAPENVRHVDHDIGVDELADDIQAHGLLQSLIGYSGDGIDEAVTYVVGGGRRLQALATLHERGALDDLYPVPVLIRDPAEAIELSLAENLARRDMNPADEFVAFAALMLPGTASPADLAKRFGFTERYVKQRLRLAALADDVLDALRRQVITLDAALAYAVTQDVELQVKVFNDQCKSTWRPHDPVQIAQAFGNLQSTTASRLFQYVGEAAYTKAGGRFEDDLFNDVDGDHDRKLRDPTVLVDLAQIKADKAVKRLLTKAQEDHRTAVAVLLVPGLVSGKLPKAPTGLKLCRPDGYIHGYTDVGADRLRKAEEQDIAVTLVAAIGYDGKLTIQSEDFFVPADRYSDIVPAPAPRVEWDSPEQVAKREAERHEATVMGYAVRLAAIENRKAGVEGRVYWDRGPYASTPGERDGLGLCYEVHQRVYVTAEEAERYRADGERMVVEEAERVAAEKLRREQEQADARAAREQVIDALIEQQPAFVVVIDQAGDAVELLGKVDDGPDYRSTEADEDEDAADLRAQLAEWGGAYTFRAFDSQAEAEALFEDVES